MPQQGLYSPTPGIQFFSPEELSSLPLVSPASVSGIFTVGYDQNNPARLVRVDTSALSAESVKQVPAIFSAGNLTGTVTLDYANGSLQSASLTGNVTLNAPSNGGAGKKLELWLTASGANRTLNLNAAIKLPSDSVLTLPKTLTSAKQYLILFKHNGTAWLLTSIVGGY